MKGVHMAEPDAIEISDTWQAEGYPHYFIRDTGRALHLYKLDPDHPNFEARWRDGEWQATSSQAPLMGWITSGDAKVDRVRAEVAQREFPEVFETTE